METTIMGYTGNIGYLLRFHEDHGKENGNYYNGFSRDSRVYIGFIGIVE